MCKERNFLAVEEGEVGSTQKNLDVAYKRMVLDVLEVELNFLGHDHLLKIDFRALLLHRGVRFRGGSKWRPDL